MSKKSLAYFLMAISILALGVVSKTYAYTMIVDPITQIISFTDITGSTDTGNINVIISGDVTTGNTTTTGVITTPAPESKPTRTSSSDKSEFENALSWLYFQEITKYNTTGDYRMYDSLTREEAAKMMVQTHTALGFSQTINNTNCKFSDAETFNPELSPYIAQACALGLMKGNKGMFLAKNTLSRPEAMTILIRMFEGKSSNELKDPRRSEYYLKGRALELTSLANSGFEQAISRYETALYIYRFQTILNDASLKLKGQQILGNLNTISTGTINTGTTIDTTSDLALKFGAIANSISVENDPELLEAVRWMNDNKLTNFNTIGTYRPFEVLLREQAAKIFDVFAKTFNFGQDKLIMSGGSECNFSDLKSTDAELITNIQNICKIGALAGGNGLFNPKGTLTKGQFITALIRLVEGKKLDETKDPRRTNYYQSALNMGIVGPADVLTFDSPITRYEVALFLYRFKVKYQLINDLNGPGIDNLIISTKSILYQTGTNTSGVETKTFDSANIFIDTNLVKDGNFELGYIDFLGNTYKIVKIYTKQYIDKGFVRYGNIYNIESGEEIGTINFTVRRNYVINGIIRINEDSYKITQINDTSMYYKVEKI